jgi:hypothetical protein
MAMVISQKVTGLLVFASKPIAGSARKVSVDKSGLD